MKIGFDICRVADICFYTVLKLSINGRILAIL